MASAASLNATATIINGQGLAANATIISEISTFQSIQTVQLVGNIFLNANNDGNVLPVLGNLGTTATQAQWLLDFYPSTVTPITSSSVTYYGIIIIPIFGTGIHANDIIGYSDSPVVSTASFSKDIFTQAQLPFSAGMAGFANVFLTTQGYASSVFDTVASVNLLQNKTYAQSGLGYNNITDLVTGGIGTHSGLLGQTVDGWGTMYDITNINLINDPYVFGQNLLNQNLGSYGNLEEQLAATGLDTSDITRIPSSTTTTTHAAGTLSTTSFVGPVDLPILSNVTTSTTVTGNSPNVVLSIYANITGANLQSIMSATGFVSTDTKIQTLADFLDFTKVVTPGLLQQLNELNINSFADFIAYITSRVGQGTFKSWSALGDFLNSVEIPSLQYSGTDSNSSAPVLSSSTISTLNSLTGSGSGPFNNPIMSDYFGAVAGVPYNTDFAILNSNYSKVVTPAVINALTSLDQSITDYYNAQTANLSPTTDSIAANVSAVNLALNSIPSSTTLNTCQTAYLNMINNLSTEVAALNKAGAVFGSGPSRLLLSFGQQLPSYAGADSSSLGTDTIISNLITDDVHGDIIRAAVAEHNNISTLGSGGVTLSNDPNPLLAIAQAKSQNIPLSTYLSQNK
jgi:hypothetical protein